MSFLVAVNFHPMWLAQTRHCATVQANLQWGGEGSEWPPLPPAHPVALFSAPRGTGAVGCVLPTQASRGHTDASTAAPPPSPPPPGGSARAVLTELRPETGGSSKEKPRARWLSIDL